MDLLVTLEDHPVCHDILFSLAAQMHPDEHRHNVRIAISAEDIIAAIGSASCVKFVTYSANGAVSPATRRLVRVLQRHAGDLAFDTYEIVDVSSPEILLNIVEDVASACRGKDMSSSLSTFLAETATGLYGDLAASARLLDDFLRQKGKLCPERIKLVMDPGANAPLASIH